MKRLRVEVTPDPQVAPRAFHLLADSAAVEETRLLEINLGGEVGPTLLFSVDGDHGGLADDLLEDDAIHRAEVTPLADDQAVLMVTIQPENVPLAAAVFEAFTRTGLVVEMPVVYRDGTVRATLVGESAVLQSALDAFPPAVTVAVTEVGEFGTDGARTLLSDRQREAVEAGLELGYYDVPRGATHRDVAERLGCAPSTASEHLQKAEAKLVRAGMDAEKPASRAAGPTRSS
ncbi:MAG: helix-turn-helix domain-containing protein [Halobacteriales archaeon]